MKNFILFLILVSCMSSAFAFRGGGGGFRGGGVSVGVGIGGGAGIGPRGNVNVGVGVGGPHGSIYAHRSAAMGAYYRPYTTSYWGWYGYAPYHYYYPTSVSYSEVHVEESKTADVGTVVRSIPDDCKSETINGTSYKHCGVNWFLPQFSGTEIEYEVVKAPN